MEPSKKAFAINPVTYFEIQNENMGIDNPTFIDDFNQPGTSSSEMKTSIFLIDGNLSEQEKIKEFERKMNEKLEDAPMHRKQWMQRISGEKVLSEKFDRRVTFTSSTLGRRYSNHPGIAVRQKNQGISENQSESAMKRSTTSSSANEEKRGIWTTSESYHNRFNVSMNKVEIFLMNLMFLDKKFLNFSYHLDHNIL